LKSLLDGHSGKDAGILLVSDMMQDKSGTVITSISLYLVLFKLHYLGCY